jgi:hypothetical protein
VATQAISYLKEILDLLYASPVPTMEFMDRWKAVLESAGKFLDQVENDEDWNTWMRRSNG